MFCFAGTRPARIFAFSLVSQLLRFEMKHKRASIKYRVIGGEGAAVDVFIANPGPYHIVFSGQFMKWSKADTFAQKMGAPTKTAARPRTVREWGCTNLDVFQEWLHEGHSHLSYSDCADSFAARWVIPGLRWAHGALSVVYERSFIY